MASVSQTAALAKASAANEKKTSKAKEDINNNWPLKRDKPVEEPVGKPAPQVTETVGAPPQK